MPIANRWWWSSGARSRGFANATQGLEIQALLEFVEHLARWREPDAHEPLIAGLRKAAVLATPFTLREEARLRPLAGQA
jgi:hypothetical protein